MKAKLESLVSKALILDSGGLRGAYGAGVAATLIRKLGHGYFDSVYGCSAGAYTGSYFASGQPDAIEAIWRKRLHGSLLVRWRNIFRTDRPILDLFYLNNEVRNGAYRIAINDFFDSPVKMFMVATECHSGAARYFSPKTPGEFFLQVRASAAVPFLHPSVLIGEKEYVDGRFSDPLPIKRAMADGHDEIVVVSNRPRLDMDSFDLFISHICTMHYTGRRGMRLALKEMKTIENTIKTNGARIRVISPSTESPIRWNFDSSKSHINALVDLGIHDALTFLA